MASSSLLTRRAFAASLALAALSARAQKFPERPIRIVIPYAPGGGTDNLVRAIAPQVGASLGQQLVIDNKPGASTMIGTEIVAKAPPDGYTLLATDSALLVNPGLFKARMPFDTLKSLQGVTMMATAPVILIAHPSLGAASLPELLALARAKPGALNYGSGGSGTAPHLAGELLKIAAKVDIQHVPYKGTSQAMNDLLAGQVHMMFGGISTARQHVESGRLRAIALTGNSRNPAMPNVPTFAEHGLKVEADSYWGVYAPAGVPSQLADLVSGHFARALKDPANADKLAGLGYIPIANTPAQHTQQMRSMVQAWADVINAARIQVE
ncbi:tripartite tricarboxylate transporter substrate binding protein [Ramlibacter henchirensis]|uniref:Tripartite tricarboxylate transporter substrate binding protein n=1 Tax=Ramlibacter henchirensis TaxID=204072 RepID=A0A4Z0BWD9_9BURK|nr:tripartite tricarboxylate transporter substrate binding protein [Ramlibacter henchirensis]TFZ02804.1 tripartite tricarboxylate transporter substrate binding protein [Ramlibacter henchirensis]